MMMMPIMMTLILVDGPANRVNSSVLGPPKEYGDVPKYGFDTKAGLYEGISSLCLSSWSL